MATETVLITGATGFVGSHVIEALQPVARVRALVRRSSNTGFLKSLGVELVEGTLETADRIEHLMDGVDAVVHLAAATRAANEREFERINAEGTAALVRALRRAGTAPRLVYLSSLAAVGPSRNGRAITARDHPEPLTAYGRTKLAGERIVAEAQPESTVVILRAPAVYGPRDRDLYEFFRMAAKGILPVPTGPPRPLQMVHAADLARAVVLGATGPPVSGVYHIAESRSYLWPEVARLVANAVGRNARFVKVPGRLIELAAIISEFAGRVARRPSIFSRDKARELLAPGWLCETEAARRDLGFEARIPLDQGLAETAKWYRAHGWL